MLLNIQKINSRCFFYFQVFASVEIFFSIGGKFYNGDPITYDYNEDKTSEESHNVTIQLHNRIGKFVKLRLHFAAKWMMISEITFVSGEFYEIILTAWRIGLNLIKKVNISSNKFVSKLINKHPFISEQLYQ